MRPAEVGLPWDFGVLLLLAAGAVEVKEPATPSSLELLLTSFVMSELAYNTNNHSGGQLDETSVM
jgi:hypothetical protein